MNSYFTYSIFNFIVIVKKKVCTLILKWLSEMNKVSHAIMGLYDRTTKTFNFFEMKHPKICASKYCQTKSDT